MNDKMIALGDKRILISSIQEYGIATKDIYYQKIYREIVTKKFLHTTYDYVWNGEKERIGPRLTRVEKDFFHYREAGEGKGDELHPLFAGKVKRNHIIVNKENYMYVKTTQGDTLVYFETEAPFDITEKCKELDEIFNKD